MNDAVELSRDDASPERSIEDVLSALGAEVRGARATITGAQMACLSGGPRGISTKTALDDAVANLAALDRLHLELAGRIAGLQSDIDFLAGDGDTEE